MINLDDVVSEIGSGVRSMGALHGGFCVWDIRDGSGGAYYTAGSCPRLAATEIRVEVPSGFVSSRRLADEIRADLVERIEDWDHGGAVIATVSSDTSGATWHSELRYQRSGWRITGRITGGDHPHRWLAIAECEERIAGVRQGTRIVRVGYALDGDDGDVAHALALARGAL